MTRFPTPGNSPRAHDATQNAIYCGINVVRYVQHHNFDTQVAVPQKLNKNLEDKRPVLLILIKFAFLKLTNWDLSERQASSSSAWR